MKRFFSTLMPRLGLCLTGVLAALALAAPSIARGGVASLNGGQNLFYAALDIPENNTTIEFWFKTSTPNGGMFTAYGAGGGLDRTIYLSGGNVYARLWSNQIINSSQKNFSDGVWHHLAYVYGTSIGGQILYVDGVMVASGNKATSDFNSQNSIYFGYSFDGSVASFSGPMDDLRIWSFAKSQGQVRAGAMARPNVNDGSLLAYWDFDSPSPSQPDLSPSGGSPGLGAYYGASTVGTGDPYGDVTGSILGANGLPADGVTVTLNAPNIGTVDSIPVAASPAFEASLSSIAFGATGSGVFSSVWGGSPGDRVAAVFEGTFRVDVTGSYVFYLTSDDGSILTIDGSRVVNNDGLHGFNEVSATVNLAVGNHSFQVKFFENYGGAGVDLDWAMSSGAVNRDTPFGTHTFGYGFGRRDLASQFSISQSFFWGLGTISDTRSFGLVGSISSRFYTIPDTYTTTTDSNGNYVFRGLYGLLGAHTIRPARSTYGFNPGFRSVTPPAVADFTVSFSPPVISAVGNQSTPEDTSIDVVFTVSDFQTDPANLSVTATSSDQTVVSNDGITITGGASRVARIAPIPERYGVTTITLTVSDGSATATSTFALEVKSVNDSPIAVFTKDAAFDGVDGYAVTGAVGLDNGSPSHTIQAWVYPMSLPRERSWILNVGSTGNGHHWLLNKDGTLQFGPSGQAAAQVSGVALPIGRWTHLAATWDSATTTYTLYMNALKVGQVVTPSAHFDFSSAPLYLATSPNGKESKFQGMIDDLQIWDGALDGDTVLAGMFQPPSLFKSQTTAIKLVAYFNFDEGRGLTYYDQSAYRGRANAAIFGHAFFGDRPVFGQTGLAAEYYNNPDLTALRVARVDSTVHFDVGFSPIDPLVNADGFSARWRGSFLTPPIPGTYEISTVSDDGVRLYLDGKLAIDNWTTHGATPNATTLDLLANQKVDLRLEWFEGGGPGIIQLMWKPPGAALSSIIPTAQLSPFPADASTNSAFGLYLVNEETPTPISLPGFDVEYELGQVTGSPPTFQIVTAPTHGTLSALNGSWIDPLKNPVIYTPAANYNGRDSFTYRITDASVPPLSSLLATIQLQVQALNDDPTNSPLANLVIEEDTGASFTMTVGDAETPAGALDLVAISSEPKLIPVSNIVFEGGGTATRTVTITPAAGQVGTATIELTVKDDARGQSKNTFRVRVDPKPAYALIDLGDLGDLNKSLGFGVNDELWAVGAAQTQPGDSQALLYRGLTGTGLAEDIDPGSKNSVAYGINGGNIVVGFIRPSAAGLREAFQWENGTLTSLASKVAGNDSVAFGINKYGDVVGSQMFLGNRRPFLLSGINFSNLGLLPTFIGGEARSVNDTLNAVGYVTNVSGLKAAVLWNGSTQNLGTLTALAHTSAEAYSINNDGLIVGVSALSSKPLSPTRAFRYQNGVMNDLGLLLGGTYSAGYAINDFGQIAGEADRSTLRRAILHTAGKMRDLNDLIYDSRALVFSSSGWSLETARAINRGGTIVGTGRRSGRERAFMAVPAWVIGKQIARPEGAVERKPEIEILSGGVTDTAENAFLWSDFEKKLYPVRPVNARLKWFTSFQDTSGTGTNIVVNLDRIIVPGVSVWPKDPIIHVAGAPVEIEPQGVSGFSFAFQNVIYETTGGSAQVDLTTKTFNCLNVGYSVINYLENQGASPNPLVQRPHLDVVRTVNWDNPKFLRSLSATIGSKLADQHSNPSDFGLIFGGSDSVVVKTIAGMEPAAGAFSIEAWVRIDAPPVKRQGILSLGDIAGFSQFWVATVSSNRPETHAQLRLGRLNTSPFITTVEIPLYTWVHIATAWDPSVGTLKAFLNGLPAGLATAGGFNRGRSRLVLGAPAAVEDSGLIGALDEVRTWNRALSESEVAVNAKAAPPANSPGLIGWYRFEGPDNVAVDSAPAGGLSGLDTITGARVGLDGDPGHQDYNKKTGFVFFERAFYDGAGPDRAYSRATRTGVIIPVNREPNGDNTVSNDLVVVWYRLNPIGVAWASKPARYQLSWPADDAVSKIVIASGKGTSALPPTYKSPRVYNQPDSTLAGYNPNEEHALIAPSADGVGDAMFALRNDLNAVLPVEASKPYALLKYKDAATDEWSIQVYKVLAEDATYTFQYTGTAGTEIQPPYPLTLLGVCANSTGVSGPWWEDYKGRLYARAAGVNGDPADVVIRWLYPLQPGFFYDFDFNGDNKVDAAVGDCVAWLDHHPAAELVGLNSDAGTPGVPVNVTYRIVWPDAPILQIGESLLDPKPGGLPGVRNMAAAKIIYDDLTPGWNPLIDTNAPTSTLAHLYDPLSTRVYKLTGTDKIPDTIRRSNRSGKEFFDDLPPTLYPRLTYDPISKWILFTGLLDTTSFAGEPLLMPNVLSSRERDVIKGLSDSATWKGMIDKLYEITRNPNRVDLLPADQNADASTDSTVGNPTPGLRLGLIKVGDRIVPESFGSGPKALTAGLSTLPPATEQPLFALSLDGSQAYADLTPGIVIGPVFTQEAWLYPGPTASASNLIFGVVGNVAAALRPPSLYLFQGNRLLGGFGDGKVWRSFSTPAVITPNAWNHVAVTFDGSIYKVFVNAVMVYSTAAFDGLTPVTTPLTRIGGAESFFQGKIEEVRFWNIARTASSLNRLKRLRLDGYEDGLLANWRFDEGSGSTAFDNAARTNKYNLTLRGTSAFVASDAPTGIPPRYLTIAENDDARLGLKINLHIIRIEDGPFRGDLKPIYPSSVFDERLTMRHSSDFGGDAGQVTFEWYYKPDGETFDPKFLPEVGADGSISAPNGWIFYSNTNPKNGLGVNDITLGDGGESGLLTLGDNWFLCRYRGYNVRGDTNWSGWVGGPDGTPDSPRPLLAEGFIKRVIRGLNPFDARVKDFHSAPSSTIVSMISQAGQRYEGDIAFNPAADAINNVGLIEAYTTVLNVGKKLSIEGTPPVNFNPANNALLLAVSRIADFYMLLGNEAYADAQDPTIGFGTTGSAYGNAAPAIFTFQNQLDSPLEEELVLLRGRDDSSAGVAARPVYNHLYWNFTLGDGEVAYQQNYNISDISKDGFIDEKDARVMFPQGHGDAWGHYLTALTTYYSLLRHPNFTWVPRPESVLVAGVAVKVDYLDERKFARAASARAKAGREIVDLTYRLNYVEEPAGQWQGYKDTDRDRAWGVDEWARRAGQGAYFDWLVANSIIPSVDPNPAHKGIQKIDRTTVRELAEIASGYAAIEQIMDKADKGLNPIGIATGAVPFDIDPSKVATGLTHFDQIYQRALRTMDNSLTLFNNANAQSQALRKNNDSLESFVTGVNEKERDLKNRMIEVFGYPYAGDIGPGGAYPSGYDGPDILHYMYVNASALTGTIGLPKTETVAFYKKTQDTSKLDDNYYVDFDPKDHAPQDPGTDPDAAFTVTYPTSTGDYLFEAKTEWGQRRAPGKLQISLHDLLRAEAKLKGAVAKYEVHLGLINDTVDLLEAQDNLNGDKIGIKSGELAVLTTMTAVQIGLKATSVALKRSSAVIGAVGTSAVMAMPTVLGLASDVTSAARGIINGTSAGFRQALETAADTLDVVEYSTKELKETVKLSFALALEVETQKFDTLQRVKTLEQLIRQEVALRLEALELKEALNQALGNYLSALAQGIRIIDERVGYRKLVAAQITDYRYQDMAFRIFQNDALQKYRAQFDLTAMYVYLAAKAYDYETCLLGTDAGSGSKFLTDIVRHRNLGLVIGGIPVSGGVGLADPLARLGQNFEVYRSQLGFLTPETETGRFSLRNELFRMKPSSSNDPTSTVSWQGKLKELIVPDLWQMAEFRKYCRPFAPESAGKQPGIVIRFPTSIMFGQNFFLWPLSGGDSAYDPSRFATKVRSAGVWFTGYDGNGLSITPRVYLFPAGQDMMRSPSANNLETREFTIVDQKMPVPFPIGIREMGDPSWIPLQDSLSETFGDIRRFSMFRAYHDAGSFTEAQAITDTRLIGRSVWNTDWILIIPGGSLLASPDQGLDQFIRSVRDIKLFFQTYAYSGN